MKKGIGIHVEESKKTSGQRFFLELYHHLQEHALPLSERPSVVLFNASASLKAIFKCRFNGQKVVLRIDGLYFDRLSPAFLNTFPPILRWIFSIGLTVKRFHNFFAFLANLYSRNYGVFLRVLMADFVVYQSKFSKVAYSKFFPKKKNAIVVNGSPYNGQEFIYTDSGINLLLIYDQGRPSKRIYEVVKFLQWANEVKHINIHLNILGYNDIYPSSFPADFERIIKNSSYIKTYGRFDDFNSVKDVVLQNHMYISFSYRDACPNVVVEAMAHGLPVVGIASGGVPDIVGNAGILINCDDFSGGFYSPHRFEYDFPVIDFEQVLAAVQLVYQNHAQFREKVKNRFTEDLDMEVVAKRYFNVLTMMTE